MLKLISILPLAFFLGCGDSDEEDTGSDTAASVEDSASDDTASE